MHRPLDESKTLPCRNCGDPINLDCSGCTIWGDDDQVQVCHGFFDFDLTNDVVLEYDSLCPKCFYNDDVAREPGLSEVLFAGAKSGAKVEEFLAGNPAVAAWKVDE
jgi:hypothetical protein